MRLRTITLLILLTASQAHAGWCELLLSKAKFLLPWGRSGQAKAQKVKPANLSVGSEYGAIYSPDRRLYAGSTISYTLRISPEVPPNEPLRLELVADVVTDRGWRLPLDRQAIVESFVLGSLEFPTDPLSEFDPNTFRPGPEKDRAAFATGASTRFSEMATNSWSDPEFPEVAFGAAKPFKISVFFIKSVTQHLPAGERRAEFLTANGYSGR